MKAIATIIVALLALGAFLGVWYSLQKPIPTQTVEEPTSTSEPFTVSPGSPHVSDPQTNQKRTLQEAFMAQAGDISILSKDTVMASPYALTHWVNENEGGEAVMFQSPSEGWVLLSMGGGSWSLETLKEQGVASESAEKLIAGRTWIK